MGRTTGWMAWVSAWILILPASPVPATDITGAEPAVRVYTNADLDKLPESPEPVPTEPAADPAEGWAFVAAHLEREHRRLDAEQAYAHERTRLQEAAHSHRDRALAWLPYGSGCVCGVRCDAPLATGSTRLRDIRPLHAGPTQAQVHREQAIRNRGSDAFPN